CGDSAPALRSWRSARLSRQRSLLPQAARGDQDATEGDQHGRRPHREPDRRKERRESQGGRQERGPDEEGFPSRTRPGPARPRLTGVDDVQSAQGDEGDVGKSQEPPWQPAVVPQRFRRGQRTVEAEESERESQEHSCRDRNPAELRVPVLLPGRLHGRLLLPVWQEAESKRGAARKRSENSGQNSTL